MNTIKIQESRGPSPSRLHTSSPTDPLLLDPSFALQPGQRKRLRSASKASLIGIHGRDGFESFEVIDRDRSRSPSMGVKIEDSFKCIGSKGSQNGVENEIEKIEEEKNFGLWDTVRRYPKSVFFILGNEFCERFSFYGMRAILVLYIINEHHIPDSIASVYYHAFVSLAYISPLFGSIVADNYFGRFRVIFWVSIVYVIGHLFLSFGAIPYSPYAIRSMMDVCGLVVIALATGGIKPCVSAFAADQFEENMYAERSQFFSFFYLVINAGSLLAIITTPILRGRISCFGSEYCFPLAFGVPGILMLISLIFFISGWKFYKITPAGKGNVIWKVCKCIIYALKGKITQKIRGQDTAANWLDYASPKFHDSLIVGVKSLVSVFVLFIPVALFWALFDQQGSTWIIQARRMDGRVGSLTILPDQINTVNPLLVILMVPIFEGVIYPSVRKIFKVTPLRKMAFGGLLAVLAFIIAGLLQLKINETMEPRPSKGNVFVYRIGNSSTSFESETGLKLLLAKNEWPAGNYTLRSKRTTYNVELYENNCGYVIGTFETKDGESITHFPYSCEKTDNGMTLLYVLVDEDSSLIGTQLYILDNNGQIAVQTKITAGAHVKIKPAFISSPNYALLYGNCVINKNNTQSAPSVQCNHRVNIFIQMGAAHVINIAAHDHFDPSVVNSSKNLITVLVRPNSVNLLWQMPQYFLITAGEVMLSVTGLEFSYSQAAPTMKSVLQAIWLLTVFFGNVINILIFGSDIIQEAALEFFFYAGLMFVVICIFIGISINYTYVNEHYMAEATAEEEQNEIEAEKMANAKKLLDTPASPQVLHKRNTTSTVKTETTKNKLFPFGK